MRTLNDVPLDRRFIGFRRVNFVGSIHQQSSLAIRISTLEILADGNDGVILQIDSLGGCGVEADSLAFFLKGLPLKVVTYVDIKAASAATTLFMAGDWRVASEKARFVFHSSKSKSGATLNPYEMVAQQTVFEAFGHSYFYNKGYITGDDDHEVSVDELHGVKYVTDIGVLPQENTMFRKYEIVGHSNGTIDYSS